jgi:hypothetical protein
MQQREAAAAQADALASAVRTKDSGLAAGEVSRRSMGGRGTKTVV